MLIPRENNSEYYYNKLANDKCQLHTLTVLGYHLFFYDELTEERLRPSGNLVGSLAATTWKKRSLHKAR